MSVYSRKRLLSGTRETNMNKITIHTSHRNLELVRVVFGELGIRDGKFYTDLDPSYKGFHLGNHAECVIVETSATLNVELVSRLGAFGLVEMDVKGPKSIGLDLSLN